MERRRLGGTDLELSAVGLGSWLTYGVGVDRDRTRATVHRALDLGVDFFDTANAYGAGAGEEALADALAGIDRSSYVLASKVGLALGDGVGGLSAHQVATQCEASLRRLGTDHLDLYQCHRWDPSTPLAETMGALTRLVEQGKVRWLGFSEWSAEQIEASFAVPAVARFASSQPEYSILCRRPVVEVFPTCRSHGIGHVVWSPLAQGVLTGKYLPGAPPATGTRAATDERVPFLDRYLGDEVLAAVQRLGPIAAAHGLTLPQLAVAWVLQEPAVASAIVGASRPDQLDATTAGAGIVLDAATMRAIDDVVGPVLARPAPRWRRAAGRARRVLRRR
jgi:aryl-alcohol dehydrogenase-like predicted oxidoreductase